MYTVSTIWDLILARRETFSSHRSGVEHFLHDCFRTRAEIQVVRLWRFGALNVLSPHDESACIFNHIYKYFPFLRNYVHILWLFISTLRWFIMIWNIICRNWFICVKSWTFRFQVHVMFKNSETLIKFDKMLCIVSNSLPYLCIYALIRTCQNISNL